jgi:hypothetical protein
MATIQKGGTVVARALHDVADSVANAFTPRTRSSHRSDDLLQDIQEIRRVSRYHRDRYLKESRRRRVMVSETEVELAVLRALRKRTTDE